MENVKFQGSICILRVQHCPASYTGGLDILEEGGSRAHLNMAKHESDRAMQLVCLPYLSCEVPDIA